MTWGRSLCAALRLEKELNVEYLHRPALVKSDSGKAPVLILLHGVGANEQGLMSLASALDPRLEVYSLRAPLTLSQGSYAWFHVQFTVEGPIHNRSEAEESRKVLIRFLHSLRTRPEVDPNKIFLMGFSQGTIMSLSLALTEPSLVRGVIAVAGRTLQEVSAEAQPAHGKAPEILLIHGKEDSKLPYFHAEQTAQVLGRLEYPTQFKTYSAGHEIADEMIQDVQSWLTQRI